MFTGIIEAKGTVRDVITIGTNKTYRISSTLSQDLSPDQSVAHDGVCLTIESCTGGDHMVTAVDETLKKTTLASWQPGKIVNIERCMQLNGRLDGHLVQGHVDTTGTCIDATNKDGSWEYEIGFDKAFANLVIEKGSICLNGISLTIFNVKRNSFTVVVVPFTYEHTNMPAVKKGDPVNLEFDVIGKYVQRYQLNATTAS